MLFVLISFALVTQCEPSLQWNMGFRLCKYPSGDIYQYDPENTAEGGGGVQGGPGNFIKRGKNVAYACNST